MLMHARSNPSIHDDGAMADRVFRKVAWRLLPLFIVCYAVAYLDRVNIGFAKLSMSADLGLGDAAYGLGAGIFFVGYVIFEVPSNIMLHQLGARAWIARIMVSWGILSGAFAFINGTWAFCIMRFLLGIAEAGFFPGILLYLTYWFPAARRGQVIALFMIAIPLAGLVGGPLSGMIMTWSDGAFGWAGWRWMFLLEALPALLLGLMLPFLLVSRVTDARWLNDAEKAVIANHLAADKATTPQVHSGVRDIITNPLLLKFSFIYLCAIMGQYGITFWLPTMIANFSHQSPLLVGLFSAFPYACAVVSMIAVGRHSDRTGERRWHVALPFLVGAVGLAVAPLFPGSAILSLALLCVAAAGTLTATPLFWNLPTGALSGRAAAVGIAAINSVGNLAGFLSPFLVGWITQRSGSITMGMFALAGMLVIGAAMVFFRSAPAPARG
ncbi:MFS transporter [Sphingobium sp. H39-3-25]|uniref:MFS transporter n=1 Tax=Sphingobium arseniciresistens TaxID=3030834 RepID=UPI0023B8A98F|nr:MFS transporter [Sphingobium arseniciresistens]